MAVIGANALTLADWAARTNDGDIADIVEMQSQTNEILDDMLFVEANGVTTHSTTSRTGLPHGTWRSFYQGVQPTKSTTAKIVEQMGMLEALSSLDKDLAELNGNSASFRLSEDMGFIEGMGQDMGSAFFYGDTTQNGSQFNGLAPRFNTLSAANANSAVNVIDGGGRGATNASIWLVGYGSRAVHGLFPKGSKAGLQKYDLGEEPVRNTDGSEYRALKTRFVWKVGLAVRDWRYVVRAANIDVAALSGSTPANLISILTRMTRRPPVMPVGVAPVQKADSPRIEIPRFAFYCNRDISTALDLQAQNKSNVLLKMDEWGGKPVLTFRGIPIRTCDALLSTETAVQ